MWTQKTWVLELMISPAVNQLPQCFCGIIWNSEGRMTQCSLCPLHVDISAGLRTAGEVGWGKLRLLSQAFCFRADWSNRLLLLASSRRQGPTGLCQPKVAPSGQDCCFVICYSRRSSWLCRPSGTAEQGHRTPVVCLLRSLLGRAQLLSVQCSGPVLLFLLCRGQGQLSYVQDQSQPFSSLPCRGQGQPPLFLCRGQG